MVLYLPFREDRLALPLSALKSVGKQTKPTDRNPDKEKTSFLSSFLFLVPSQSFFLTEFHERFSFEDDFAVRSKETHAVSPVRASLEKIMM